jgi:hypothetical protein
MGLAFLALLDESWLSFILSMGSASKSFSKFGAERNEMGTGFTRWDGPEGTAYVHAPITSFHPDR